MIYWANQPSTSNVSTFEKTERAEMKIAYLLLVHTNPKLIERTIRALDCGNCAFFIHVDKKSDISRFSHLKGSSVFFTEQRIPVYWGQYSQVDAILLMLRQALKGPETYDYCVLVSGSDYPLRSAQYISSFLERNHGSEFISCVKMPNDGKPLSRINTVVVPSSRPILRFVVRVLAKLGLAKRDYRRSLGNLEPYAGSTWWGLTRQACHYITRFVDRNPRVVAYFRYTFASDESLFHTILGNSDYQARIRRNFVYDDWHAHGASPEPISDRHDDFFRSQSEVMLHDMYGCGEALFARKFSDDRLDLVERIDDMILSKEKGGGGNRSSGCVSTGRSGGS